MGETVSRKGHEHVNTALVLSGYEIVLPSATGETFLHQNEEPLRIDPKRPLPHFTLPGYDVLSILSLPSQIDFLNTQRRVLQYGASSRC